MAKETEKIEQQAAAEAQQPAEQPARPNRDRYSAMFAEDNPDVDFEDKEARYERLTKDRDDLRKLRTSGKAFSGILDKHRWLGAMLSDEETNPLVWMAKHGIDIKAALDDPEAMQQVTKAFDDWKQKQAEGEAAESAKDAAIEDSLNELASVQQEFGLSDEQFDRMWTHFWDNIFLPAFAGKVTKDTWVALMHAMNYDTDMANAREEAAMQARNEKHANKVKTFEEKNVPPTFGQGAGGRVAPRTQQKDAHDDLADFIKKNG